MKFEKRILTSIFLFFLVFPYNVFAKFNLTAIIRNNLLENVNEVYLTLNIALKKIESTNIRNAYLKIDYVGKSNQLLKSDKNPLAYDEILKCFVADDLQCFLNPKLMNIIFKNVTCKLDISINSFSEVKNEILGQTTILWGDCGTIPIPLDPSQMEDLLIDQETLVVNNENITELPFLVESLKKLSVGVKNEGKKDFLGNIKMDILGEDRVGNIIYASTDYISGVGMGELLNVNFSNQLKQSVWHRLCRVRLFIDTKYKIAEENKANNEQVFNLGLCEDPISYNDGGKIDFRPWIKKENDMLILYFFNMGHIAFNEGERVKFNFTASGVETQENRFSRDIVGEILPFGDFITYKINQDFIADKCHFTVHVNPDFRINESDYSNNIFELDICN